MIAQFPSEVAQRIFALLKLNKTDLVTVDGTILYGDQIKIPTTPTVCVEAGTTTRALDGVAANAGRTRNDLECLILVYYSVVQDDQVTKLAAEQCGENIAKYLDDNPTLELSGDGGIVIHGYITSIDPGYSRKGKYHYAVRLTWNGKSKTILGA